MQGSDRPAAERGTGRDQMATISARRTLAVMRIIDKPTGGVHSMEGTKDEVAS